MTVFVAVVGLLVSAGVALVLHRGQRQAGEQQLHRRAAVVAKAVTAESGRYVDALRTVSAAAGAFEPLTASKFAQASAPLTDMRLAGATSISFLVPATDAQVTDVQARWQARGAPELVLQPVGTGHEHIFSVFSQPLDGSTAARTGIDATQSAPASQALTEARRSGRVTISEPYQLIIDQKLPAAQRQMSFVVTTPVYGPADASGQRPFHGWVVMGMRGRDFISATLGHSAQGLLDVTLRAPSSDGTFALVAEQLSLVAGGRDLSTTATVTVGDRPWRLQVSAAASALPGGVTAMPAVIGVVLAVLALLLAVLVWVLATGRARALNQVRTAIAGLSAAEGDARRQAELLTAVLDNISDGVGVVDHNGEFLLHNPAAKAILGIGDDRSGADNWQDHYGMFRPDGRTPFPVDEMPLVRALAGEPTDGVEMLIRNRTHPDGVIITVSGRPLPTADGRLGAVAVFHDITARKKAETELAAAGDALRAELGARTAAEIEARAARDDLAAQQAYLVQVLDAIEVTVITCDTTGAIVHANRTARGAMPAGSGGATIAAATPAVQLTHPDGTPVPVDQTPLMRALTGEFVQDMEATIPLPDGRCRNLLLHARPLHDADGAIIGAVAASYNVTALREREADLHAFAGVAAHDLKAPLAAIAGYAELLDEELSNPNPMVRKSVVRISAGIDRMRRLIDDLLTYATTRDGHLNTQPVDLQQLVTDVITERTAHLRAGGGEPALFPDIYTGPLPVVHADPAMIRQLLDNLIGNAIKYTLPGQPARIDIAAHMRASDNQIYIVIADRGIGIPASDQPHVFDTFHRAANRGDRPGTGLGLAICKRITDRHHGTITVTDNPGGGSRFIFTLPMDTSTQQHPTPGEPGDSPAVPAVPRQVAATAVFGLTRPTIAEVRQSLTHRLGADAAEAAWPRLADQARLSEGQNEHEQLRRLIDAMTDAPDRLLNVCARAIRIRIGVYDHLSRDSLTAQ